MDLALTKRPTEGLRTYPGNPRRGDIPTIAASLARHGQYKPIVLSSDGVILVGNHTYLAARSLGWDDIDAVEVPYEHTDPRAREIVLVDNRSSDLGSYDTQALAALLSELSQVTDLGGTGYSDADLAAMLEGLQEPDEPPGPRPSLADRFLVPPFSVLNARQGWWRTRKHAWLATGISSQHGRDERLVYTAAAANPGYYDQKEKAEARLGRRLSNKEFEDHHLVEEVQGAAGTSVFDPVLCEILYRWFSPVGGLVLDPWAGGSVRGLVAAMLGRRYVGIDLSAAQVQANREQAERVLQGDAAMPDWRVGDCTEVLPTLTEQADVIVGCPPYFDLEVYSEDPRDLSVMDDAAFAAAYRTQLQLAAQQLRPDRFCALVVSAARDKKGHLRDLRGLTVQAMAEAGLPLYNEAVLVTPVGSMRISTGRTFASTRVMGRVHQDVLVFVKGDRQRAAAACGEVAVADIEAALAAEVDELAPDVT